VVGRRGEGGDSVQERALTHRQRDKCDLLQNSKQAGRISARPGILRRPLLGGEQRAAGSQTGRRKRGGGVQLKYASNDMMRLFRCDPSFDVLACVVARELRGGTMRARLGPRHAKEPTWILD
jgi:hypothetical protein